MDAIKATLMNMDKLERERDEARALKVPASTEEVLQANMAACVARAELAEARAECERLRDALKFYANGDWCDGYPGGVRTQRDNDTYLDFGDEARAALERNAAGGGA